MKVNMTPNPLDVVTIHASQGDSEARQWEFELHNNGELIDTSEITEQLFFKAYNGGTEQILPENTSTPTTSPFLGDIRYPQGLLTDQEFTYRESPTESDGLAKITDIKGNTVVWNQLVQNGNFADSSLWSGQSTTISISNNIANVTLSAKGTYVALRQSIFASVTGHKFFVTATFKCTKKTAIGFYLNGQSVYLDGYDVQANTLTKVSALINGGESGGFNIYVSRKNELEIGDVVQVSNVMLIDLTKMGLDSITDPSEFTSLFSLPYYDYCQGAMLSFGGRNVKFNQIVQNGNFADVSAWNRGTANTSYTVSGNVATVTASADGNNYISQLYNGTVGHKYLFTVDYKTSYIGNVANFYYGLSNQRITVDSTGTNDWITFKTFVTARQDPTENTFQIRLQARTTSDTFQFRNCMLIDLTEMFGAGNEPSAKGFRELFPNNYYEYTTGKYMNIGQPMSLKTVGFNQWDEEWEHGSLGNNGEDTGSSSYPEIRTKNYIPILPNTEYYLKTPVVTIAHYYGTADLNDYKGNQYLGGSQILNIPSGTNYIRFRTINTYGDYKNDICLNVSDPNKNGTYEPYAESTLSIPLDEFPNGMDGINDVRDEKNETGYVKRFATIKVETVASGSLRNNGDYYAAVNGVTNAKPADNGTVANMICNICETMSAGARYNSTKDAVCARTTGSIELCISGITSRADLQTYVDSHDIYITYELATPLENYGIVDLGTLNWEWQYAPQNWTTLGLANVIKIPSSTYDVANILCARYTTNSNEDVYGHINDKTIAVASQTGRVRIYDSQYNSASDFKSAMSGVYLLYEKENPKGFTTASLVTENAEIPLSNEDGILIGKCTEQLSENPGFIDAKIKLADADGECYSNKIQLHVERKP